MYVPLSGTMVNGWIGWNQLEAEHFDVQHDPTRSVGLCEE
jgi:hypothetical protein|tara:strand:- start:3542 stop:3661 length:120 start_codon:yes stop_codon:yes gene_type:complete